MAVTASPTDPAITNWNQSRFTSNSVVEKEDYPPASTPTLCKTLPSSPRPSGEESDSTARVVAVALANKTARIAWAVMVREKEYQPRAMAA
jgi:hypothetical protein